MKASTKRKATKPVDSDPMRSSAKDEPDVDENCQVADLASVPAPKIQFEMPILSSRSEGTNGKLKKAPTVLTANSLNNEIVHLRNTVVKARVFVSQQLLRKKELFEKRIAKKKGKQNLRMERKLTRIKEELSVIKEMNKHEVAKFALLNRKERKQLVVTVSTPPAERCLYRIIGSKPMTTAVQLFRSTYPDWESRTAYLLQRLGLQYAGTKTEKKVRETPAKKKKVAKDSVVSVDDEAELADDSEEIMESTTTNNKAIVESSSDDVVESASDEDDNNLEEDENEEDDEEYSDVEMGSDSEDDAELAEKRRNLLFDLAGIREDRSRPKLTPKRHENIVSDDDETNDVVDAQKEENDEPSERPSANKKSKTVSKPGDKKPANTASVVHDLLEKTLNQNAVSKKRAKLIKASVKAASSVTSMPDTKLLMDAASSSQTVVKQVKLSAGGRIKMPTRSSEPASKVVVDKSERDSEDDSEGEAPPSNFFLAADGTSSRVNNGDSTSGEESVDDDEDVAVEPVPKKGGNLRKMSSVRERFQAKHQHIDLGAGRGQKREKAFGQRGGSEYVKQPRAQYGSKPEKGQSGLPEELHPSWAARRQAKEQQAAKPQGKKTIFSDD